MCHHIDFPAVNILSVGMIFNGGLCDTIFVRIFNY